MTVIGILLVFVMTEAAGQEYLTPLYVGEFSSADACTKAVERAADDPKRPAYIDDLVTGLCVPKDKFKWPKGARKDVEPGSETL